MWSRYEDEYVRDHYQTAGARRVANVLRRAVGAVKLRARKLGVTEPTPKEYEPTPEEIASECAKIRAAWPAWRFGDDQPVEIVCVPIRRVG